MSEDTVPQCVKNLLAIIHRDAGQHREAVGLEQACKDAEQVVHTLRMIADVFAPRGALPFPPGENEVIMLADTTDECKACGRNFACAASGCAECTEVEQTYFPMQILMMDTQEVRLVNSPAELPEGQAFKVLKLRCLS